MFWPFILPIQITLIGLVALVLLITVLAPCVRCKRISAFFVSLVLGALLFIPSCSFVMSILDERRFGEFHYATYSEVADFRVERYLPFSATNIALEKIASGHRAMYTIEESELIAFLDYLWQEAAGGSAISRKDLQDGATIDYQEVRTYFDDLDWPPLGQVKRFHSPVQDDGGGATYYFDPIVGRVYHRAGYW